MPPLRRLFVLPITLVALVAAPALAHAQTVEVRARPGAGLFVVTDDGRVSLGTLNDQGALDVPERLVESGKNLEVVLESSATAINVALVERGRNNPVCAPDAPTGVTCVRTGTFVTWGRVDRITISPAGQVTVEGEPGDDDDGPRWGVGVIADLDVARAYASNDDRLCREAATLIGTPFTFICDTESATDAFNAALGITFVRVIALKVGYLDMGRLDFGLTGTVDGAGVAITGRVGRTRGPTFSGALRLDVGWPVVPFVEAGLWRWSTDVTADVAVATTPPTTVDTSRSLSGWNPLVAGGVEFWPARYVGVQAGIKWVRIEEEISDLNGLLDLDDRFRLIFVGIKIGIR